MQSLNMKASRLSPEQKDVVRNVYLAIRPEDGDPDADRQLADALIELVLMGIDEEQQLLDMVEHIW